jgi:hypothetical protein
VPGPVRFKLYNIAGMVVRSGLVMNSKEDGVLILGREGLAPGVYILKLNAGASSGTGRVVFGR